ncbi:hypothetical protein [Tolypothrix sp. VBCCA 56010]|uniref:hypothetical protein n=1 Tax=Tolypothrix sp. VBCCA 56010 TaxID=3137731 RepID=UPI003D7D1283
MNFTPTSITRPCPTCEDTRGRCRHSHEEGKHLCMTCADTRKGEIINGYKCLAHFDLWAAFCLDNSQQWSDEQRREWEAQKVAKQQAAKKDEQIRRERALSVDERDRDYSEILEQFPINSETLADLQRRGLTQEEIERSGFKSVKKWQPLKKKYGTRLPGISEDGKFLVVSGDGYLCPVRDFEGRITSLQLRLHNPQDGNRYKWESTPDRATLKLQPEDENPLAVFHPPSGKPEGIAIVEGTGCKPFFVSQRLNLFTIGAAGGQWLSSPQLLEKYIKQAINKYGNLPIIAIPDAGWALNSQVKQKLSDTLDWLKDKFSKSDIRVFDWNQIHKSQGDIDELDDLSIVRKLKVESFLKKYKEVFGQQENKGFASKRFKNWAENRVKLTADIVQHEKWLTIPQGIQNDCDILLIRKSLGGGKTQALIEFLKASDLDVVSLLIGYRNSLLNNTIARANAMGLKSQHIKDKVELLAGTYVDFSSDDSIKLWGGCADSYFKFNDIINRNPDYYLIHDEICSVLGHLKGGGTLKGRQKQAIEWDTQTIQNSQFAIMMDANLCDKDVNFIRQLFPDKRIKVLDSVSPQNPRTFHFLETASSDKDFTANPKYLPSHLVEKAKAAKRPLWISDSQRSCEIIDEILTEGGHKHFRLDGKTSHDELSKQLQAAPKEFILVEKLDSLSISPSGESGLSIDLYDYFDAVCFDIRGTVGVNTLTQLSARLRDTKVPIYVACPEFVNMTTDPCPYAMKSVGEVLNERIKMLLAKSIEVDNELLDSQFVCDMFADMGKQFANDPWFIESLKDSKQLKYEHQNLKLMLKTALTQAGNRVIDLVEDADDEQYDEYQEVKEKVKIREAEKVFNSENIEWEKAQELSKKDVDYDTKCKIRKARIKHKLPGIEETGSWNANLVYSVDVNDIKFIDSRWRLKQLLNDELFDATFKLEKKYSFENSSFTPQDIWKYTSTKIEALKQLGITRLINAYVFSTQDDWVREIINKYYDNPEWHNLIGIPRAKRSPNGNGGFKSSKYIKDMLDRFLDYFGLEAKEIKEKRQKNSRFYSVTTPKDFDEFISDIDNCLGVRAENAIASSKEVSLKGAADKAEETLRQRQELEQCYQAELEKQRLATGETDNCQPTNGLMTTSNSFIYNQEEVVTNTGIENPSVVVTTSNSFIYNQEEVVTNTGIENVPDTDEWLKPEHLEYIASLLADCESCDMLQELRECDIPPFVFKQASRYLEASKREQIRQWVISSNANGCSN